MRVVDRNYGSEEIILSDNDEHGVHGNLCNLYFIHSLIYSLNVHISY